MTDDARIRRSRAGLRAALVALLAEMPFEQVTIREVAARAGVGYTTYFRHYPGKEALLDDVIAAEVRGLTGFALPLYDAADSGAACLALCRYVQDHRLLWTALLTGGAAGSVKEELLRQGRMAAARSGEGRLPPDLGIALAIAVTMELMAWWLRQAEPWPAERVAAILDQTGIRPLIAAQDQAAP